MQDLNPTTQQLAIYRCDKGVEHSSYRSERDLNSWPQDFTSNDVTARSHSLLMSCWIDDTDFLTKTKSFAMW